MATISSYRNALVQLANQYSAIGWACDLVCKAILNDGVFTDGDIDDIANSFENGAAPLWYLLLMRTLRLFLQ